MNAEQNLNTLTDGDLVQCYLDGNNFCFTKLVERHHTHIHNFLHYKLRNAEWEKDAEQETFITASVEIKNGHYLHSGHLSQWLNSIAYHEAMKILRSENHYAHVETAFSNDEQEEKPEEELSGKSSADTALLRFALKKLSPHYRQALELRNIEELSFKDIGLQMNISEASACTLYGKARRRMKVIIENIKGSRQQDKNKRRCK
jgi:RNA polymerase sigma-70 factor (ECF subfamily)